MTTPLTLWRTQLTVLQEEEYSLTRWWQWWLKHPFQAIPLTRKKLVWTPRMLAVCGGGLIITLLLVLFRWYVLIACLIFPIVPLSLSLLLFMPVNWYHDSRLTDRIIQLLGKRDDLIVIGITGSYGKSTVKEILYEILDRYRYTLTTPQSFNTLGGIERVVRQELNERHVYFLVEMGAYIPGDIRHLAETVTADYGILTSVGPQHLERFKTQEKITQTKFELVQVVPEKQSLVNWDNEFIRDYVVAHQLTDKVIRVSLIDPEVDFYVPGYVMSKTGIRFTVVHDRKAHDFSCPVFGTSMLYDAVLATSMAWQLSVPEPIIRQGLLSYRAISHRLALTRFNQATVIDNTYSSNVEGFTQIVTDLKAMNGKKALVTPGIVELGGATEAIHLKLGQQMAHVFDEVVLIGDTDRTRWLREGIEKETQHPSIVVLAPETELYWQKISELSKTFDWILLENDLPDKYY